MKKILAVVILFVLAAVCIMPIAGAQGSEPVTLVFAHGGSTLDYEVNQARIALFEKQNPDIKVQAMHITDDIDQKYTTMFAGGTPPDILWFAESIHSYSSKGLLRPLNTYLEAAGVNLPERNAQAYIDMYTYDGNIYGLQDRGGSMVAYYNKTLFDEAGLSYPTAEWTWDDMLKAAKALTKGEGEKEQWGFGLEYWFPYWMNWCYQNGGRVIDDQGKVVINSKENLEALTFMQELLTVHDVIPSRIELADFGSGATAGTIFARGRMGMMMNGLWSVASLQEADFEWGIVEIWKGKEATTCPFGSALAISTACKHPEEAFRFINFMNDEESQKLIVEYKQDAPANLKVLESPLFTDAQWAGTPIDLDVFNRQAVYSLPLVPQWAAWNTIWSDALAGVFDGTVAPADALNAIEAQMNN